MPLSRKSIILTGAGRGIGRAVATKLASEGARLALVARTEKEIQETYELIKDQSPASFFIKADISSRISLNEAFSVIKSQMDAIDVLINNAGIQQPIGLFHENNMDDWEQNIKTNLLGPANFIYLVLPIMIKQRKGKIINFPVEEQQEPGLIFQLMR